MREGLWGMMLPCGVRQVLSPFYLPYFYTVDTVLSVL